MYFGKDEYLIFHIKMLWIHFTYFMSTIQYFQTAQPLSVFRAISAEKEFLLSKESFLENMHFCKRNILL